jgi:diacylglycerol kinase (ATP)
VQARNLKIDLNDLKGAVSRALHGNRHPIDLGLVRLIHADGTRAERVFSVMAGMGLDAKIFQKTDPKLKKAIGWVAYIDGGIKSLPTLFERMDVSVDSRKPQGGFANHRQRGLVARANHPDARRQPHRWHLGCCRGWPATLLELD